MATIAIQQYVSARTGVSPTVDRAALRVASESSEALLEAAVGASELSLSGMIVPSGANCNRTNTCTHTQRERERERETHSHMCLCEPRQDSYHMQQIYRWIAHLL